MAHLEVRPKSRQSRWWIWLLIIIIIIAAAFYFLGGYSGVRNASLPDTTKSPTDSTAKSASVKH